ncbi:hypothetical protein Galf_1476 [Gallionella capsiferriformans ES-2]|uniref:Uncharacterized protein n=1 Tax=Gallionella capsiferriformans (strain ES-2) TaxID=395494 RepID=D9SG48_GALCS|nr:hypothetical protein Galf_1476 [Gallionella capsiferriformans ES-2]
MSHEVINDAEIHALVKRAEKCLLPLAAHVKSSGFLLFIRLPDGRDFELHFPQEEEVDSTL